mgnify:CR=1 FL=1
MARQYNYVKQASLDFVQTEIQPQRKNGVQAAPNLVLVKDAQSLAISRLLSPHEISPTR